MLIQEPLFRCLPATLYRVAQSFGSWLSNAKCKCEKAVVTTQREPGFVCIYSHYNLDICIYSLTAIEICLHEQENSKRQGWSNWPNRTDGVLSGPEIPN